MVDIIGESVCEVEDSDITDEEIAAAMIEESIGYGLFADALTRFMPRNVAMLYTAEQVKDILDQFGFDYSAAEDHITDLVLTHFCDGEHSAIIATHPEEFLDSMFVGDDETSRKYAEAMLYSGKLIQYSINSPENETETEEEENDDE